MQSWVLTALSLVGCSEDKSLESDTGDTAPLDTGTTDTGVADTSVVDNYAPTLSIEFLGDSVSHEQSSGDYYYNPACDTDPATGELQLRFTPNDEDGNAVVAKLYAVSTNNVVNSEVFSQLGADASDTISTDTHGDAVSMSNLVDETGLFAFPTWSLGANFGLVFYAYAQELDGQQSVSTIQESGFSYSRTQPACD